MENGNSQNLADRAVAASRGAGLDRSSLPLLAGFFLLLLVGGVIVWLVNSSQRQSGIVFNVAEIQRTTSRVYRSILAAESGQRGYLLTADESYLAPYRGGAEAYPSAIESLLNAAATHPEQAADARLIQDRGSRKLAELARTIALQKDGHRDAALALVKTDLGRDLMTDVRNAVDRIQDRASRALEVEYEAGQTVDKLLLLFTLAALAVIVLLGVLAVRMNRRAIRAVEDSRLATEALNSTLEAAVAERTAELTESNEEIQRFAYIVSHDLRAPLVNVMGFTSELEALKQDLIDVAGKPAEDPARVRVETEFTESIGFIKAAIDKMEGLIAAILRLSREGRRTFRPESVDTTGLIEGLADAQRHQTDEAGAVVAVQKDLPALVADRVALEQIFGNLLDNAIKYLDPTRPGRIDVSGETVGSRARISVRDNGRGIAEHDHKRVFELFRRSGEQNRPGDGIGLAHVQTLVRSLGGRIVLASELGKGTTFTVVLPLRPKTLTISN